MCLYFKGIQAGYVSTLRVFKKDMCPYLKGRYSITICVYLKGIEEGYKSLLKDSSRRIRYVSLLESYSRRERINNMVLRYEYKATKKTEQEINPPIILHP